MSKKKIFALVFLVIFIPCYLISLYYYSQHIVTVKELEIGEIIEVSEGIVFIHNIEMHNFEGQQGRDFYDRLEWFYDSIISKLPREYQITAMNIVAFYNKPYNFDLGLEDVEGSIVYINGLYISDKDIDRFHHDFNTIINSWYRK
ncbi:hypothetical protein SYNTR_0696 [Candidatus Syntrophocurvum alkaliphilum]|uniref:Uncharacterized protein n=1 Tax=Candidatus Syntrophocurvum alkaliphilum TaxID=2293317 RepID=A0A6I6DA61_9FIRM|nr:hypothetical protein [Candidatus Syntrophocurvum alkaliphilum]QGT99289.1 hypothetical protein SYNTR_0696 [Candidatus Syntrophocurvum alkaliphilum]